MKERKKRLSVCRAILHLSLRLDLVLKLFCEHRPKSPRFNNDWKSQDFKMLRLHYGLVHKSYNSLSKHKNRLLPSQLVHGLAEPHSKWHNLKSIAKNKHEPVTMVTRMWHFHFDGKYYWSYDYCIEQHLTLLPAHWILI